MNEKALVVFGFIKCEPHGVSISKMIQELEISREVVWQSVDKLLELKYIKQDGRYRVETHHMDATYYTEVARRSEIDPSL